VYDRWDGQTRTSSIKPVQNQSIRSDQSNRSHKNNFFNYLKNCKISRKSVTGIKCVSFSSTTLVCNIRHFHKCFASYAQDAQGNTCKFSCKERVHYLCQILIKTGLCKQTSENSPISNFMKNHLLVFELLHANRQTWRSYRHIFAIFHCEHIHVQLFWIAGNSLNRCHFLHVGKIYIA
jgi:hypothetical protein